MEKLRRIALIAQHNRKHDLLEWIERHYSVLIGYKLISTKPMGDLIGKVINNKLNDTSTNNFDIIKLKSGTITEEQQLGEMITEGKIDLIILLIDPLQRKPQNTDIGDLLKLLLLYDVPTACNLSTATFMISSPIVNHLLPSVEKNNLAFIELD